MSNNIFIDLTEEIVNKGWSLDWEFNEGINVYKYNGCTTIDKCKAINSSYKTDLDTNGAWLYHLGSLTIVNSVVNEMFKGCTALTSFGGDLSSLNIGLGMFQGCTALTTFSINLPKMTNGDKMFMGCTALTSFNSNLPKLSNGIDMFNGCTALTSFNGDLTKLSDGSGMFNGCSSLTSFNGDLSSLESGRWMFTGCSLSEESIMTIADTIGESDGRIDLDYDTSITDTTNIMNCCDRIVDKGWNLFLNGTRYVKTTE